VGGCREEPPDSSYAPAQANKALWCWNKACAWQFQGTDKGHILVSYHKVSQMIWTYRPKSGRLSGASWPFMKTRWLTPQMETSWHKGNTAFLQMAEKLLYVLQYAVTQSASKLRIFDLLLKEAPELCPIQAHPAIQCFYFHIKLAQLCAGHRCVKDMNLPLYIRQIQRLFSRLPVEARHSLGQPRAGCQDTQTNQDGG